MMMNVLVSVVFTADLLVATEVPPFISATVPSVFSNQQGAGPHPYSLWFTVANGAIAIHHRQFEMAIGSQLFYEDVVPGSEHLADLHEGFVFGLRNNEDDVKGHSQADRAEDQVTVRTCRYL